MTLEDTVPSNKEQKALGENEKEDKERDGFDIPESSQDKKNWKCSASADMQKGHDLSKAHRPGIIIQ